MLPKNTEKKYEINMTEGPLFGKIIAFSLPLIASGILQLLFNAADIVVAGRFAGSNALAAVGSTSALINLLINLFIGLSVGANVTIAHYEGAGRGREVSETVHTSIALSVAGSLLFMVIGLVLASPLLSLMGTPEDVIGESVKYMRIYFCGLPFLGLFNFGSSILRAVGDTKRPLYYLSFAGVINVILNLIFVIVLQMGVSGVALATIISQGISATLVIKCLTDSETKIHLDVKAVKLYGDKVKKICRVGIPAGLQGCIFSISNVLIQSSINSFGAVAMAGNTAAANLEGFVYNAMTSFHQTGLSFTGQNMGARKFDRIRKIMLMCQGCVIATGLILGWGGFLLAEQLLGIYTDSPEVIGFGLNRMSVTFTAYAVCGAMDVCAGVLRGMGRSILPMVVSLMGSCVLRIVWIFTVFRSVHTLKSLYISYPVSWALTFVAHLTCFIIILRKMERKP